MNEPRDTTLLNMMSRAPLDWEGSRFSSDLAAVLSTEENSYSEFDKHQDKLYSN